MNSMKFNIPELEECNVTIYINIIEVNDDVCIDRLKILYSSSNSSDIIMDKDYIESQIDSNFKGFILLIDYLNDNKFAICDYEEYNRNKSELFTQNKRTIYINDIYEDWFS